MDLSEDKRCPCGTGETYGECCARRHGGEQAATAEQLMRARFTAFATGNADYLRASWHPRTRPRTLDLPGDVRWTRLDVLATTGGGLFDASGTVDFRAHYREDGVPGSLHENSEFTRLDGRWVYVAPLTSS